MSAAISISISCKSLSNNFEPFQNFHLNGPHESTVLDFYLCLTMSAELIKSKFARLSSVRRPCRNYLCSKCIYFFQILVIVSSGIFTVAIFLTYPPNFFFFFFFLIF